MIKKSGVTITVMVITIIILIILAGTITFSAYSTINYSTLSSWANEVMYIQEIVDEELNTSSSAGFTSGNVIIDLTNVMAVVEQFQGETISEDNTVTLKILDLGKLKITNTQYGNLKTSNDIYAVSEQTGKVYYVLGLEVDGQIHYTVTDELKNRFGLSSAQGNLTSVVFVPNVIGYSNNPITLTVKIPNTYTNIVISTSNDEIQIGSQSVKESTYEYVINANNIAGNYTVTVSYNNGTKMLTSSYTVNGYDITAPKINPITYENIVYKQTEEQTVEYLTNITATDDSGIKVMKYALGTIDAEQAKEYFANNTNIITNSRINLDRVVTVYTIYVEDNAGNFEILTFDKKHIMPQDWKDSVSYIQDRVPIPKGFVASGATGENKKAGGLVIYEGTEAVTDENVETARITRNQYVWVPVAREAFVQKFVRRNFGNSYTISNTLGTNYWEVVLDMQTNMPLETQNSNYVSEQTLKEVQAMYSSVKEYEGFYVARYEAGIDNARTSDNGNLEEKVYFVMGKIPYTYIQWGATFTNGEGGAVEVARNIYPVTDESNKYGVVSTLIYGVQWDCVLQWWLDTKAVSSVTDSTKYGNYSDHVIRVGELNKNSRYAIYTSTLSEYTEATSTLTKPAGTSWALSTGALKAARINNIYDMAGNMWEYTMEGLSANIHCNRAGFFFGDGSSSACPVSYRALATPNSTYLVAGGFRTALYIK